ncbi:MAG: FAD-dependent oxidoreductase [Siphonobacter sp.]
MDLHSDLPYWSTKNGIIRAYPSLQQDTETDIAIIGAGITGALVGYELMKSGFEVTLLDCRHVGMGSTSASTALLQYEIDTHLTKLQELYGPRVANRSYLLCLEAIDKIHDLCREVQAEHEFQYRKSLYYASYKKHVPTLRKEFEARKAIGIEVSWLTESDLAPELTAPAAILSEKAAQVDPYQLAHALLAKMLEKGCKVHNQTKVIAIEHKKNGVILSTKAGFNVMARNVVIAGGYESQKWLSQPVEQLHASYAIISEPSNALKGLLKDTLIWETARPYLYMRTTSDGRILVGGRDDDFYAPEKRDKRVFKKGSLLEADFKKHFPDIPIHIDFRWAGTFAETKDGLPYIGIHPERPHTYFALGFGGNGITFSSIAADLIRKDILKKANPDATLFAFNRAIRKPD